jgi:hypothetical protein
MSNNWVVIIFLLFMVLMMSLYLGSQDYSSFAFTKSGFSEYPYEGFATYQEAFYNREGYDKDESVRDSSARDSSARDSSARDSSAPLSQPAAAAPMTTAYIMTPLSGHANPLAPKSPEPPTKPAPTKEGFETLTGSKPVNLAGSSYVAEQKPVAFLYNNDANTTCKNYGYTNSKGFICMSSSDIQLLTTRGGNAAGVSDQIGK